MHRRALFASALLAALLTACGVNPVTHKRELHLVSEQQELQIGAQQYLPSRESQGGDLVVDPELTAYVRKVGAKLAAVSDRQLPYEFTVLASGVPNAWALPGGKVAVNRGLLVALENEAELAAVLGHEITHAAARHGAQSMERGMLAQVGLAAIAIGESNRNHGQLVVGAAALGASLIQTKYGRDAESEADHYGMVYMARAGYDPHAAVTLQQKFVQMFKDRKQSWLDGMFATHPPSAERVIANIATEAKLPKGGELGADAYRAAIAGILRSKDAYDAADRGRAALAKGDAKGALALAQQAIAAQPGEALFHGLAGTAQQTLGDGRSAAHEYDLAIERNPEYFEFWLRRGLLKRAGGDAAGARADLERSQQLLPTAASSEALGSLALAAGDEASARRYLQQAAGASSPEGQRAAATLAGLEIGSAPERYLAVGGELDARGMLVLVVGNRAPIAVEQVEVVVSVFDPQTRVLLRREPFTLGQRLAPGMQAQVRTGLGPFVGKHPLSGVQLAVRGARAVR